MKQTPLIPELEIIDDARIPLYRRIAEALCQAVISGQIVPGERLPTREALAGALNTSPVTVGRGYEWLQGRGLVEQKRRSGTRLRLDALAMLGVSSSTTGEKASDTSKTEVRFSEIVVVLGEPDLAYLKRDCLEIVTQILAGVTDVLGDCMGRYRFVKSFDLACVESLQENAAVLHWKSLANDKPDDPLSPALLHELSRRDIPILGIWGRSETPGLPAIDYSPYQAVNLACQHLLDCGYRRLGYVGSMGPELAPKFFEFTNVLFKAGLDFQFCHVRDVELSPGSAYFAATQMAESQLPDAFFVDADWKAMEVVTALTNAGFRVPEDIAVIGYGDIPDLKEFEPRLTTVRLPRRQIGQAAGRQLLAWAHERTPLHSEIIDSKLVIRNTTSPALETADAMNA